MYIPNPLNDGSTLGLYLSTELNKLADALTNLEVDSIGMKVWHKQPDKPRTAQIYYADGTNWNPVSGGEGVYVYLSTGSWSKL
jgi:hypothetical protein